ncbi:MAG: exo-alpha-sialidase [Thaumarchaeota archaeon]|nr:exo-alpha-sialidase [Nitrososphaerota archaeon]
MKILHLAIIAGIAAASIVPLHLATAQVASSQALVVEYQLTQLLASGNHVYVTYQQNGGNGGQFAAFFRESTDGGATFGRIISLDNSSSYNPTVASVGTNVYLAWMEDYGLGKSRVMFERSTDGGSTFSAPIVLSNNTSSRSNISQIIASGSNVYVLMIDELRGNTATGLSFRASHDSGATFGNPLVLLEDAATRGGANIALSQDGGTIFAYGQDSNNCPIQSMHCNYELFVKRSTDGGATFGRQVIIENSTQEFWGLQMSTSGKNVYLKWEQNGTIVNLARSNDGGLTFAPTINLSKDMTIGQSIDARIASYGNNVYVTWENNAHRHPSGLFLTRSTDGGSTFSEPVNLSGDIVHVFSHIVAYKDGAYITWMNRTGDKWDEFFTKSSDNGSSFDKITNLTGDIKYNFNEPQVAYSGQNVYLAFGTWYPGNDIMFLASRDGGNTFEKMMNLNHYGTVASPQDLIHVMPPLQQSKIHVFAKDVTCNPYLTLVFKAEDGSPACVEPASVDKLMRRGWAMPAADPRIPHIRLDAYGSYTRLDGDFLKGYLDSIAGPIANGQVTVYVNGTEMGTASTDQEGCFQFNQWDEKKISRQIDAFAALDQTRTSHGPPLLQFYTTYGGDISHYGTNATAYLPFYLYAVPLAPAQFDTTIVPSQVNVTKGFGPASFQVSVSPIIKEFGEPHMKLYLDRLPCGMENYDVKMVSDNDTSSVTHPAVFNFTMYAGSSTPTGRYFITISHIPSETSRSWPDVGSFTLNVLKSGQYGDRK